MLQKRCQCRLKQPALLKKCCPYKLKQLALIKKCSHYRLQQPVDFKNVVNASWTVVTNWNNQFLSNKLSLQVETANFLQKCCHYKPKQPTSFQKAATKDWNNILCFKNYCRFRLKQKVLMLWLQIETTSFVLKFAHPTDWTTSFASKMLSLPVQFPGAKDSKNIR